MPVTAPAEKRLTCAECGTAFQVPTTRGRYPRKCETCDPQRHAANIRARQITRLRGSLDDLWGHRRAALYADTVRAAMAAALEAADTAGRVELRQAITHVAHARGRAPLRAALVQLAGIAIAWAARIPASETEDLAA